MEKKPAKENAGRTSDTVPKKKLPEDRKTGGASAENEKNNSQIVASGNSFARETVPGPNDTVNEEDNGAHSGAPDAYEVRGPECGAGACGSSNDDLATLNEQTAEQARPDNLYDYSAVGPFVVMARFPELDGSRSRGGNRRIALGNLLIRKGFSEHTNITHAGKDLYRIVAGSACDANLLVREQPGSDNGCSYYIPSNLTSTAATIRGIPLSVTIEEIQEHLRTSVKIKNIYRLKRKCPLKGTYIETQTVKITFAGRDIPKYVVLFGVRLETEYYIPPTKKCFKCLNYGHRTVDCKSPSKRCLNCAGEGCDEVCQGEKRCYNCGEDHVTFSRECREWAFQNEILRLITIAKISRREAVELLDPTIGGTGDGSGPFTLNEADFPSLGGEKSMLEERRDHQKDANEIILKSKKSKRKRRVKCVDSSRKDGGPGQDGPSPEVDEVRRSVLESPIYQRVSEYERMMAFLIKIMELANKT